jgi:hypothetical protein
MLIMPTYLQGCPFILLSNISDINPHKGCSGGGGVKMGMTKDPRQFFRKTCRKKLKMQFKS